MEALVTVSPSGKLIIPSTKLTSVSPLRTSMSVLVLPLAKVVTLAAANGAISINMANIKGVDLDGVL